ncbi:MAG: DUF1819 family protein [Lachnospiraceae bacterium]|jgi:hypothetical protein|nr:DUF1819 family protein [Lachnospiraceae bacterium]
MEYSAGATKHLFWFVETRETARLLRDHSTDEVRTIILDENLYQQKSRARLINEFGCIRKRLEELPEQLCEMMITADINTGKLIAFIGCMASDRLLFDLIYEVYRKKLHLGEPNITNTDLNVFFKDKQDQNEKVALITDTSIKKLKQVYCKYMSEAGLLTGKPSEKRVVKPYIDPELRSALMKNGMEKYLAGLTGQ